MPVAGNKNVDMTASIMLHSSDACGKSFRCDELLTGTRSALADSAKQVVDRNVQEYLQDPSAIPPPATTVNLGDEKAPCFGKFFDEYSKCKLDSKPLSWFEALTADDATEMLGGLWRHALPYKIQCHKEVGIKDCDVPTRFTQLDEMCAKEVASLELYGGLVHQALEVVGKPHEMSSFNIGIHVEKRYPGDLDILAARCESQTPAYVLNLTKVAPFGKDGFSAEKVWQYVYGLRNLAHHEAAHAWCHFHDFAFWNKLQDIRDAVDYAERETDWSWYNIYCRVAIRCYLRLLQDGSKDMELLKHVFVLQAPRDNMEGARYSDIQEDISNVHDLMKRGQVSQERDDVGIIGRVPLKDVLESMKKTAAEQAQNEQTILKKSSEKDREIMLLKRKLEAATTSGTAKRPTTKSKPSAATGRLRKRPAANNS